MLQLLFLQFPFFVLPLAELDLHHSQKSIVSALEIYGDDSNK
jgi:hypothetical protein